MSRTRNDGSALRKEGGKMQNNNVWNEPLIEENVTYSIEIDNRFILIENVPARVNIETGEKYFAPEIVERLQQAVWKQLKPVRVIETPVFEYASIA